MRGFRGLFFHGHFYFQKWAKSGQMAKNGHFFSVFLGGHFCKSGQMAKKSGQMAIFENKSGQKNGSKMGQKGPKMGKNGLFWGIFRHFLMKF